MKNIALISTGGTIAGSGRMSEYEAGTLDVRSIIDSIPEIKSLANLKLFPLCSKDSNDITEKDWLALRDLCHQLEKDPSIDGIVITHGTDTFEETAFFLNLTLQNRKPVVMTGAMRSASAVSADGPMNLYEAVSLASHPNAYKAGVLAVFADTIYSARDLVKTNSLKTNAFDMGEYGALGFMRDEHVYFENMPYRKHTCESLFAHLEYSQLPRVGIFMSMQERILSFFSICWNVTMGSFWQAAARETIRMRSRRWLKSMMDRVGSFVLRDCWRGGF